MTWSEYLNEQRVSFAQRVLLRGIFAFYGASFAARSFCFEAWNDDAPLDGYDKQERDAWQAIGVVPELFEYMTPEVDGERCVYVVTPEIIIEFHAAQARQAEDDAAPWLPFAAREDTA